MKNSNLIVVIIVLIPIVVISFLNKKETNFFAEEPPSPFQNTTLKEPVQVPVNINNEIVYLNLEEYVIGVVAAEMPASFHEEALKAQAVASRTYAINKIINNQVLEPTVVDQAYINEEQMRTKWLSEYDKYYTKIKNATYNTEGLIMTYKDEPIIAYYFSMSNGITESSATVFSEDLPYLQPVASTWEMTHRNFSKDTTISELDIIKALNLAISDLNIQQVQYSSNQRLQSITINNQTFTGIEFRHLLGLRSTDVKITKSNDKYIFTTRGYGHGVGMSQYGANGMAIEGHDYQNILKHYYQDIEIKKYNA